VLGIATHPEDDVVLATALSGNAQFLVTGDYKLVERKHYQGLILVTVRAFLAMLPGLPSEQNG
jgi:predicted nucleic acid-binding protein